MVKLDNSEELIVIPENLLWLSTMRHLNHVCQISKA